MIKRHITFAVMQETLMSNSLTEIEQLIWVLLQEAVASYKAPFHNGVFANIQDGRPEQRTVILRKTIAEEKKLFFHTDLRSPKLLWLQNDPNVSWLFYNEALKLQLRINAVARVHYNNETTGLAWEHTSPNSRLIYTINAAPGERTNTPASAARASTPTPEELETARQNFVVVETTVENIDWVYLHHTGNRRGFIDYVNSEHYWMQP